MATREALGIDPVEPYSKIIKAGGLVYVKSHVGYDLVTGDYPEDIATQTRNALLHLEKALHTAGAEAGDIVKISVYLSRIDDDFDSMDRAYNEWFAGRGVTEMPVRTTIGSPLSWPQLLVQMDMIAVG
jgi:2-iminobutanoate/2-iminopropanoate deaminase